jgi:hypothetical protein
MSDREQFELADWISGENPQVIQFAKDFMGVAFKRSEEHHGIVLGEVTWSILRPGDDRAPEPPKAIENPVMVYGVADVLYRKPRAVKVETGITNDLEPKDLIALRQATRRAHRAACPGEPPLTDAKCDEIINRIGPETIERDIRKLH